MSPSAVVRDEFDRRLAQALVGAGLAGEGEMRVALDAASAGAGSLAAVLIGRETVARDVVLGTMSQLAQLPVVDLDLDPPSPEARRAVPSDLALEYHAVGFRLHGSQLAVAFGEPPAADDLRVLSALVGYEVVPVLADPLTVARFGEPPASPPPAAGDPLVAPGDPARRSGPPEPVAVAAARVVTTPPAEDPTALALAPGVGDGASGLPLHIDDLLRYAVSVGASDLHLTTAMPGCIRLHGAIRPIEGCPKLTHEQIRDMVFGILPQSKREQFEASKELDTSHSIAGVGRFRVNVFLQRGTVAAVLRAIPHEIPPFDTLGIPEAVRGFAELRRGLVLVTGPTGSGKSTTLAALVDIVNASKPLHIITVEDPIEFLHTHKRSIVNQREVGQDTASFAEALKRVLREDPDVILVGEMRDLETISMALTAAETGHLVFGTLHTQDAPQTIDRVVDVFPTSQQEQVRTMLAGSLEAVVTQQLVVTADGIGRAACCEVMVCTSAVRNLIRSSKTHQIYSLMQTGAQWGMQTMDQGLARLVHAGRVSEAVAFERCRNEADLRNHLSA